MKIIFMGTPEFALPTLKALSEHHQVVAVYTQRPKPAGRGQSETLSPVHEFANSLNLPVYTPKTLRNLEAQEEFKSIKADCAVVIAYGLILPKEILEATHFGCINIHPSMLPKFRGAAPMQRTILAGEKETAMCIMQMDEGIDTGDILALKKVLLSDDITYQELLENMAKLGSEMLINTLENINTIIPQKQTEVGSCYANKILKEEAELKWTEPAEILMRKVRALNPWPGTFFTHKNEKIKVIAAQYTNNKHLLEPGFIENKKTFNIACLEGTFQPLILQRPGKKPTKTEDFLRGYKIEDEKI